MPVSLNTFATIANTAKPDQSIFIKNDQVKAGTSLHRANTFRNTTQQFIQLLGQEYGAHMGELASELLKHDVEAGKPLKAAVVKEFIALGKQHGAKASIDRVVSDKTSMESYLKDIYHKPEMHISDQQFEKMKGIFRNLECCLVAKASGKADHAYDDLVTLTNTNYLSMVRNAADLILGNPDSPLVICSYPNEDNPELLEDKLSVLKLLAPMDARSVNGSVLSKAMLAVETLRLNKPAPETLTGADIFNAIFPPALTPTMERPTNEEIALYSPSQMQKLMETANMDSLKNLTQDVLPEDSVCKGHGSTATPSLRKAIDLLMPDQLQTLTGNRVTLQDLPQIKRDVTINSGYPSLDRAKGMARNDLHRLGSVGIAPGSHPPAIVIANKNGNHEVTQVGLLRTPEQDLTEDQKNYNENKPSDITDGIFNSIHGISHSDAQEKALVGALTQNGVYPLVHTIQAFGDSTVISEHSAFNYTFQENEDNSVDVTVSTSPDIHAFNGTGTLTYHIEADGRTGISDFQWDKPTVEERKDALLHSQAYRMTVPGLLARTAENPLAKLSPSGKDFFLRMGQHMMERQLGGVTTHAEIPGSTELKNMLDLIPGQGQDGKAERPVDKLLEFCRAPAAMLRIKLLPPEQQLVFCEAIINADLLSDTMAMDDIMSNIGQMTNASKEGPLTPEVVWNVLYNEPMPQAVNNQGIPRAFSALVLDKRGDLMMEKCNARVEELNVPPENRDIEASLMYAKLVGLVFGGVPENIAWDITTGNLPEKLSLEDVSSTSGFVYYKALDDMDAALSNISRDLHRIGDQQISDTRKKLPDATMPGKISIHLPGGDGTERDVFEFQPKHPEGLSEEQMHAYLEEDINNPVAQNIKQRVMDFCGEDHMEQACGAVMALGQGGQAFAKTLSLAFDTTAAEHADMLISMTHDDDRNIHVHYENVEGSPLLFHWDFVIAPDGTQTLGDFNMQRADANL